NGETINQARLISVVDSVINPFADYEAFLQAGENPHLQFILSNTTEAGITFDPADASVTAPAGTFPGKLTALLYRRFRTYAGDPARALVILPCELIENNGEALRQAILKYSEHWRLPDAFRQWISEHTGFCNTLVDRIVPGFPKDNAEARWQETGYRDELMVSAEPYHLWVIQPITTPSFTTSRLKETFPLEQAGIQVKYADDLAPYRTSKVRILNGALTCMVPVAWLQGIRTVREAIDDPSVGTFIREAIEEEIIPTLDLPSAELKQFADDVVERFKNPFIRHELSAIALNSVSKFQVRVLPSILEFHRRRNALPKRLLKAFAALMLFYKGEWKGERTAVNDTPELLSFFEQAWKDPATVVHKTLSNARFWKSDLTKIDGLADELNALVNNYR